MGPGSRLRSAKTHTLGQRPESEFAIVTFRRSSRRAHSEGHVRILGIGQDELAAARRVSLNRCQLSVERLGAGCGHLELISGFVPDGDRGAEGYWDRAAIT